MPEKEIESKQPGKCLLITAKFLLFAWIFFWWAWVAWRNRVLLLVYPSLLLPWDLSFEYFPFLQLLYAGLAMAAYIYAGHLFLGCFRIFIPRIAHVSISLVLGISLITFLGEICGIIGVFNRWGLVGGLIPLYLVLLVIRARRWSNRQGEGEDTTDEQVMHSARLKHARREYQKTILQPNTPGKRFLATVIMICILLITLIIFYHALLYPISYWDSFLYLGTARRLFLDHHFSRETVAQIGKGIASAYPQMYRLANAVPCAITGSWSNWYAKLLAPLCGIFTLLLVYHIILRLSREKLSALAVTLMFCCIPYGIRYFTFTSDYALTILFTTAFFYLAIMHLETGLNGYLSLSGLAGAFACHINYLMPLLFLTWCLLIIVAHKKKAGQNENDEPLIKKGESLKEVSEPGYTFARERLSFLEIIKGRNFLVIFFICLVIISTWYVRNMIVTGNPVYPYFHKILDGKHINPDVLASMQGEWLENGDGIDKATMTLLVRKMQKGEITEEESARWISGGKESVALRFSLPAKLYASIYYFVSSRWSWALAPLFISLAIPGIIIWLINCVVKKKIGMRHPISRRMVKVFSSEQRICLLAFALFCGLWGYHYLLAGYYIYQILPILVPLVIFAYMAIQLLSDAFSKSLFCVWCLLVFLLPGLPFGLMNFKLSHPVDIENKKEYPFQLAAFRRPGMPPERFYALAFGEDARMWGRINGSLLGKTLLTHDNRYLLYDPSIKIIHLDDWEVQKAYKMRTDEEKLALFQSLGIHYYLKIPMEEKHEVLRKLSLEGWEEKKYLMRAYQAGGNILYYLDYSSVKTKREQTISPDG